MSEKQDRIFKIDKIQDWMRCPICGKLIKEDMLENIERKDGAVTERCYYMGSGILKKIWKARPEKYHGWGLPNSGWFRIRKGERHYPVCKACWEEHENKEEDIHE